MASSITTADGVAVSVGDQVFSHYTMSLLTIVTEPNDAGWFYLRDDFTYPPGRELLNGERICSLAHARRMGWLQN